MDAFDEAEKEVERTLEAEMEAAIEESDTGAEEQSATPKPKTQRLKKRFFGDHSPTSGKASTTVSRKKSSSALVPFGQEPGAEGSHGEESEFKAPCPGCQRRPCDLEWFGSAKVAWALPHNRGAWCQCCFGLWRCCYSSVSSLSMFSEWLSTPSHFAEYEAMMVAYLTLRKEGFERVSATQVISRRNSIAFALQLMALPSGPFEVISLEKQVASGTPLEAARLCNMVSDAGEETIKTVVYLKPMDGDVPRAGQLGWFARPRDLSWQGGLASRSRVRLQDPSQEVLLQTAFADVDCEVSSEGPTLKKMRSTQSFTELDKDNVATWGVSQKLGNKVVMTLQHAHSLLLKFADPGWQNLSSGFCTAGLGKVNAARAESAVEDAWVAVRQCEAWAETLENTKKFLKKHTELKKAKKDQQEKLEAIVEPLEKILCFMRSKEITPHSGLELLLGKAKFLTGEHKDYRLATELTRVLAEGLGKVLARPELQVGGCILNWVRSLVLGKMAQLLRDLPVEKLEEARKQFIQGCEDLRAMYLEESYFETDKEELIEDARCLGLLYKAGGGNGGQPVRAREAEEVAKRLKIPAWAPLQAALQEAACGLEVAEGMAALTRRASGDLLGDKRLEESLRGVKEKDAVQLEESILEENEGETQAGKLLLLKNSHYVLSAEAPYYSMATQCLDLLYDATNLWSRVRLEEKAGACYELLMGICKGAWAAEAAVMLAMDSVLLRCKQNIKAQEAQEDSKEMMQARLGQTAKLLQEALAKWPFAHHYYAADYKEFEAFVKAMERVLPKVNEVLEAVQAEHLDQALGGLKSNMMLLQKSFGVLKCLACRTVEEFPASSEAIIQLWGADPEDVASPMNVALYYSDASEGLAGAMRLAPQFQLLRVLNANSEASYIKVRLVESTGVMEAGDVVCTCGSES